jgi:hypothetical protein
VKRCGKLERKKNKRLDLIYILDFLDLEIQTIMSFISQFGRMMNRFGNAIKLLLKS